MAPSLSPRRPAAAALVALALAAPAPAAGAPPSLGPWPVNDTWYKVPALDATDPSVWLIFPVCNLTAPAECPRFPLISYAHGLAGGDIDLLGYAQHFYELASYGFVVAAPDSCDFGCTDPSNGAPYTDCAGTPPLPPVGENWPPWYGEQLKAIEWARNQTANATGDAVFATIDWDAGVGIAGHSMGGQATAMSASPACAARWGVRAAVLHHPADGELPAGGGHIGVNMSVPVASFTSSGDSIWPETVAYMAAANASEYDVPRAYRDLTGSSHLEPVLVPPVENPFLATFTAAWFKVFLNGDRGAWYDLVFGGGADSLCRHAPMTGCYVLNTP